MFSGSDGYYDSPIINTIYIVEKLWTDPLENREAHGYEVFTFFTDKCDLDAWLDKNQEMWGQDKCWSLMFGEYPLYRVKELEKKR
jgi:hypothetical protein